MSPIEIEIMLHYYYSPHDFCGPGGRQCGPVQPKIIDNFVRKGLLSRREPKVGEAKESSIYSITELGKAYVKALQAVQIPVEKIIYVQPEPINTPSGGCCGGGCDCKK